MCVFCWVCVCVRVLPKGSQTEDEDEEAEEWGALRFEDATLGLEEREEEEATLRFDLVDIYSSQLYTQQKKSQKTNRLWLRLWLRFNRLRL